METEANLEQTESVAADAQPESPVAEVPAPVADVPASEEPAADVPAAQDAQPEEGQESQQPASDEAPAADEAQQTGEEGATPYSENPAEAPAIVATPDVAPAASKLEVARIAKEALIERAKEIADSTDWRKASEVQRTLMDEWRAAGYAGKELNDKLWDDFRAARDAFFSRRDAHYAELREQQSKVIEAKRAIIQEAKEATAEVRNWVATAGTLDTLMDRWKAAGNAGRENEQALWDEFNGIRRDFRNRRKADLAERRAKERENAAAKRAIVDEAQAIASSEEYTRENSDRMRQLTDDYKAAGFAGKPANDTLWQEFRAAQNSYWEGNNARRDQQRRERSERLQEAVERKSGQIEHLKDQNETLTTRLESTLNPEKVAQIKRWIEENEQRLGGLKDDIDQIKKKI